MKKEKKELWIYMLLMVAFCAIMLFGLLFGPEHPQIFFWAVMAIVFVVIGKYVRPTLKDSVILIAGVIVLAIWGEGVERLTTNIFKLDDGLKKDIVSLILLAPIYFPIFGYFLNICTKIPQKENTEKN